MVTFPQAPLRSRTVGFPESGSDPGFPLRAFPPVVRFKRRLAYAPTSDGSLASSPLVSTTPRRGSGSPPALCPGSVLGPPGAQSPFARGRCYRPRGGVSRHLEGRYPFVVAHTGSCVRPDPSRLLRLRLRSTGLRRLPSAPAGFWPFPTLSPRVLPQMPDPLPRRLARCTCPFLPSRLRPSPRVYRVGALRDSAKRLLGGVLFRGCRYSVTFRPPGLLATQVVPTAPVRHR